MAKRPRAKPTRKQRKQQREKSVRAREHGLPSREIERPSKSVPPPVASVRRRRLHDDEEDGDEGDRGSTPSGAPESTRLVTLAQRIRDLPVWAKLGVVAVVAVLLLWVP